MDKTSCDCNPLAIDWVLYLAGLPQPSRAELLHPAPLLKAAALQQPQAYSLQVPSEVCLWLTIKTCRMLKPLIFLNSVASSDSSAHKYVV